MPLFWFPECLFLIERFTVIHLLTNKKKEKNQESYIKHLYIHAVKEWHYTNLNVQGFLGQHSH